MLTPLIISGPSGVGKTYLEKYLIKNHNFQRIQSTTTRPMREGEINGEDYHFVTEEEYEKLKQANKFITSSFHLNAHYGFEKSLVEQIIAQGKIPVTIVVPTIVPQFITHYPDTVAIYLQPTDPSLVISRMKQRGDSEERIKQRQAQEASQTEYFHTIQHLYTKIIPITPDNFSETINTILELFSTISS